MSKSFNALFVAFLLLLPGLASAATVDVTVSAPTRVSVGQEFQVVFSLRNAVDIDTFRLIGAFSPDLLEWRNIQPAGTFENTSPGNSVNATAGTFSFGGFSLGDTANGNNSAAIVTFRAKQAGTATVRLLSGTQIYSAGEGFVGSLGSATIAIGGGPAPIPKPLVPLVPFTLTKPASTSTYTIISTSHPDPNAWYANGTVLVTWQTTKPIKTVFGSFDQSPEALSYDQLYGSSVTFHATKDGVWYAHIVILFEDGTYARVDLPIRIDRTPPHPITPVVEQTNVPATIPNHVYFATTDDMSGIDHYEVAIDGVIVTSTKDRSYPLTNQAIGEHTVEVTAYDRAGNHVSGKTGFTIIGATGAVLIQPSMLSTRFQQFAIGLIIALLILWFLFGRRDKKEKNEKLKKRRK
jgi:hypothetical protein